MTNENEQKESMVFYRAFYEAIEMNPDHKTKAECYKAIINYALNGTLPTTKNKNVMFAFNFCKQIYDVKAKRYLKCVENGKKGGAPLGNQNARKKPKFLSVANINFEQPYIEQKIKAINVSIEV